MKKLFCLLLVFASPFLYAQNYPYDISESQPFGKLNPAAPSELMDFGQLVGMHSCLSYTKNQKGEWKSPEKIIWRWKYIMNGLAVQDETLKPDGSHSGSIRAYDADSLTWRVHYYTNVRPSVTLSVWTGGKVDNGDIVLYKNSRAPNGKEGYFRLTFADIKVESFEWIGEWVDKAETTSFPTWKISCKRDM